MWLSGFPLFIVEAKRPDEPIEAALREAQLYANRINNRYPPGINPISYVMACNGQQFALAAADSETEILFAKVEDMRPGTEILGAYRHILERAEFEKRAEAMNVAFQSRRFHRAAAILTGGQVNEQIGVNSFAHELFPIITEYFGREVDEEPEDIMDRGYVTTEERTEYGAVLESYLKDRARVMAEARSSRSTRPRRAARTAWPRRSAVTARRRRRSPAGSSSLSAVSAPARAFS